jgi:L-iditol 2-dehydrogenase
MPVRACVIHGLGDIRCEDVPVPQPPEGHALIRVSACGICGSDLGRTFDYTPHKLPLVPGHEVSGTIAEISGPSRHWSPGDRVVVEPMLPDPSDPMVAKGLPNLASTYDYIGSRRNGGFAEYLVAPLGHLYRVPESVPLDTAALVEPSVIALHALRMAGDVSGKSLCVLGLGPIGLILAQWAKGLGSSKVLGLSRTSMKLELARRLGVQAADASTLDPVEWVAAQTDGLGADVVIEGVGAAATIAQSMRLARPRGTVVLLGNPSGDIALDQYDYWQALRRELTLVGVWNATWGETAEEDEWVTTIAALEAERLDLAPLITQRVSLEEVPKAMARMHSGEMDRIKVLVVP